MFGMVVEEYSHRESPYNLVSKNFLVMVEAPIGRHLRGPPWLCKLHGRVLENGGVLLPPWSLSGIRWILWYFLPFVNGLQPRYLRAFISWVFIRANSIGLYGIQRAFFFMMLLPTMRKRYS